MNNITKQPNYLPFYQATDRQIYKYHTRGGGDIVMVDYLEG